MKVFTLLAVATAIAAGELAAQEPECFDVKSATGRSQAYTVVTPDDVIQARPANLATALERAQGIVEEGSLGDSAYVIGQFLVVYRCDRGAPPPEPDPVADFPMDSTTSSPVSWRAISPDTMAPDLAWWSYFEEELGPGVIAIPLAPGQETYAVDLTPVTWSAGVPYACDVTRSDSVYQAPAPAGMSGGLAWYHAESGDRWRELEHAPDRTAVCALAGGRELVESCGHVTAIGGDFTTPPVFHVEPLPEISAGEECPSSQGYLGPVEVPGSPSFQAESGGRVYVSWEPGANVELYTVAYPAGELVVEGDGVVLEDLSLGDWLCVRDARAPADGRYNACNTYSTPA